MDHTNIDPPKHLNRSHVHLNRSGDNVFEDNLFLRVKVDSIGLAVLVD